MYFLVDFYNLKCYTAFIHMTSGLKKGDSMKVKPEHRERIKKDILSFIEEHGGMASFVEKYETGVFHRSEKVKDLNMRFCFDMINLSGLWNFLLPEVYPYANDEHIHTVVRSILPTLTRRY